MLRDIEKIASNEYELLVIGAGINGAAIANIAGRHGIKTVLLEKGDFSGGTSSKSTKLIHGGLRYLENLEFGLVKESLRERCIQLKAASHLVKPLQFIIPVYQGDKRPLWLMRLGVSLYDFLSGKYVIKKHRNLSADEVLQFEPQLKKEGLEGGVMYSDAQMDDARLCLENVLSAAENGADTANYAEVISFVKENGKVKGVEVKDQLTGAGFRVRAKKIICAAGPWTNILLKMDDPNAKERIRVTKGSHIVYSAQLSNNALLIPSGRDNRVFFIIPWMGCSLIGTTDTDYTGSPDKVEADDADIEYLLEGARRIFPAVGFNRENIVTTFAGLRPLLHRKGSPSRISRRHLIFETPSGITFVIGGKYTTYRKIAYDALNRLSRINPQEEFYLSGQEGIVESAEDIVKKYGLDLDIASALLAKYGSRYKDVLKLADEDQGLKERLCPGLPLIKAQVVYAFRVEMAKTKEDVVSRRLSIAYLAHKKKECEAAVAKLMQDKSLAK